MSSPISYNDMVTAVRNAYAGNSSLTWSEVSQALARGGCTTDNYLEYLQQFPGTFDVVANADGSIRSVSVNAWASAYDGASWESASAVGGFNSNLLPSTTGGGSLLNIPGTPVINETTRGITFNQGLSQAGNFVMREVVPAVAAAGIGISLGRAIDGTIYNIGNALGLNPPDSLNPETWASITADDDSLGARVFNMVFGIDDNGNTQAYIDQDAFAYMAQWMSNQGYFNSSAFNSPSIESGVAQVITSMNGKPLVSSLLSTYAEMYNNAIRRCGWAESDIMSLIDDAFPGDDWAISGHFDQTIISVTGTKFNTTATPSINTNYNPPRVLWSAGNSKSIRITNGSDNKPYISYSANSSAYNVGVLGYTYWEYGSRGNNTNVLYFSSINVTTRSAMPDGISVQPDAVSPDTSDWTNPQATLDSLRQQYPDLFNNEVTQQVVQPDGTIREYHYIPIGMPEPDGSTGTQTQQDTTVDPGSSTQTLIDYITQILTRTTPVVTPQTDPRTDPTTDTDSPTSDGTENPPDTGDGDTPVVPPVVGSASSLWKIYNPTQGEIDSFGAWLWSSDFIEQIKKLFNDPMQAIIGVHKVFCSPSIGGTATIKCGYIDSGVSSKWVSDQYTHIDCGTVQLPEYFGNVFDYDPFTRVSLFLPCIGIVPLDVAEVMRASINIKLHCDVLTGALLAEVSVTRDGAGGNLYTYSGSCIVTYPVSSGSYIGAVANVVSVAASVTAGIMGTVASGGALAPAAVGAAGAAVSGLAHTHTNVQHSGAFSGAAGVMGGKIPYLIITRPQTRMAGNYPQYDGLGANYTSRLSACSGYVRVKEVHLKVPDAYESEIKEIESLLHSGILI